MLMILDEVSEKIKLLEERSGNSRTKTKVTLFLISVGQNIQIFGMKKVSTRRFIVKDRDLAFWLMQARRITTKSNNFGLIFTFSRT